MRRPALIVDKKKKDPDNIENLTILGINTYLKQIAPKS